MQFYENSIRWTVLDNKSYLSNDVTFTFRLLEPISELYLPTGHGTEHFAEFSPGERPTTPAGHYKMISNKSLYST